MRPFWIWRRYAIPSHEIGPHTLTPIVQLVGMRWPGGGWLWQFPLAVEVATVEEDQGVEQRLPVPDPTRTVVWFLYGLALVLTIVMFTTLWRQRRQKIRIASR